MKKEHSAKLRILERLSDGKFHSGEELGEELGISRAAISKHMKGLGDWGVDIHRVQGKGYRLPQNMKLLDQEFIANRLDSDVEVFPVIDSTNQYLLESVEKCSQGQVCIAEYQTQARGRRGRQWVSPFGSNLYLSMYWRLDAGMAAAMGLSLVIGIASVEALEELGIQGVKLKWPNDLYHNDQKLAGILVEMSGQAGGAAHLVIGMGLNVGMSKKQYSIDQPWTTISEATGYESIDRSKLAATLIKHWHDALNEYEYQGLAAFIERWNRLDNFVGRDIKLLMGPREVRGVMQGINEQGGVVIKTAQGVESYVGGEISLRSNEI